MAGVNDEPDSIRNLLQGAVDGSLGAEGGAPGGDPADLAPDAGTAKPPAPADNGQGVDQSDAARQHRAEQAASRARDEAGRFAPKPPAEKAATPAAAPARETLKVKDPAVAATVQKEIAENGAAKPAEQRAEEKANAERLAPPADWKGAGKVQWDKLPAGIQKQLHEDHQQMAAARAEFAPLQEVMRTPAWSRAIQDAGSPAQAAATFGEFYHLYLTNPVGLINHIARERGIQLGQPAAPPAGQTDPTVTPPAQQQQTPDLASLIAQAVQQHVAPIKAHFEQTETNQLQSTIEAFRADPKHPYFEDVKVHMGRLLNAGAAKDMQDAYDQATWANPVIRQQLLEAQAEATAQAQAAEVQRARDAAAASVRGSPLANAASVPAGGGSDGSIRGDLMAAFRQQQGAV